MVIWSVGKVAEIVMDPQTQLYFRMQATARRTRGVKDHYIVCGLGRVGRAVAEELSARSADFLVLEKSAEVASYSTSRGWLTIHGDAAEDRVLEQAGVERARGLICCVDSDAENLFIIMSARAMNANLVISTRANDDANLDKLKRAGANHAYSPYSLLGRRIARSMTRPRVLELLDLALEQTNYDLTIEEAEVPGEGEMVGKSLAESRLRQDFGAIVLSIIRSDRSVLHNPASDTLLQPGDILIMLGTPANLDAVRGKL